MVIQYGKPEKKMAEETEKCHSHKKTRRKTRRVSYLQSQELTDDLERSRVGCSVKANAVGCAVNLVF